MTLNFPVSLALSLLLVYQDASLRKPSALLALEQQRKSCVVSGRIDWSVLPKGDQERELKFVSRFARNGDTIFEHRGDKDGWTVFEPQTRRGSQKYPLLYMTNADGWWEYMETTPSCGLWKRDGEPPGRVYRDRVKDILAVGVYPSSESLKSDIGLSAIWKGRPGGHWERWEVVSWDQTKEDGLYVVTANFDSGYAMTWQIDPARGWNARRVALVGKNGKVHLEAICTLKQYDGVWLPETTTYLRKAEVVEVVRLRSASLNAPDDPPCFSGNDLGLEPGTNIVPKNVPVEPGKILAWNGENVSTWAQWIEDTESGRRQWGPMFQRINRGEGWDSPYMTDEERLRRGMSARELAVNTTLKGHEGLWLRYVRDFIKRYRLNDEQSQKAMAILARCQSQADQIVTRDEPRFTQLVLRRGEASKKGDVRVARRLTAQINKLREPIQEIFEKQLKPRLDKLPTRAQRKAADERSRQRGKASDKP